MRPLMLIILDGWGYREEREHNGIALAKTPIYKRLLKEYPWTLLKTSGHAVGLPEGVMGNSEVGHMNIGSGRVAYQGLSQIYHAIEEGSFFKNPAFLKALETVKKNKSTLHLMGLVSDGAVHSHIDHLFALLELAKQNRVTSVMIHCFMDGRDTTPVSGADYISQLEKKIKELGIGKVATIMGRYWAMDRDKRWERIEKAERAIVDGEGENFSKASEVFKKYYQKGSNPVGFGDEFIHPSVLTKNKKPVGVLKKEDAVIFFNFRADRARQLTQNLFKNVACFTCMMEYDPTYKLPVAFRKTRLEKTLGEIISKQGWKQLRIAETEKYAHVTYFFNGGEERLFDGEERILIPSPKEVPTYDKKPEMSASEMTAEVLKQMQSGKFQFIVLNFANPDMVGHTAVESAIIKAVETVDSCLGKIVDLAEKKGWDLFITADHGNCEEMVDVEGHPHTQHTVKNPVPLILVSRALKQVKLRKGKLANLAPTILEIFGLEKPAEMTEDSLIIR